MQRLHGVILVGLLSMMINVHASTLQEATEAYKDKNYDKALGLYQQLQNEGSKALSLNYNMGVCLYRLQRYEEASPYFLRLLKQPRWKALAEYNLGLVYQAQGQKQQAIKWFEQALQAENPQKIRLLAQRKLSRLQHPAVAAGVDRALFLLRVGGGYDDNAASVSDELSDSGESDSDSYTQAMLYGQYYLAGKHHAGWKLNGMGFAKQYSEYGAFDNSVLSLGLGHEQTLGSWYLDQGLKITHIETDKGTFADQLQLKLGFKIRQQQHSWSMVYMPGYYDAGEDYQHIEGSQHKLDLLWQYQHKQLAATLRLRMEQNDREDLQTSTSYYSYSAERQGVMAELKWRASDKWQWKVRAEYKDSEHDKPNRLTDSDGIFKEQIRETETAQYQLQAKYRILPALSWQTGISYKTVDDNFLRYTYDKQVVDMQLDYRF